MTHVPCLYRIVEPAQSFRVKCHFSNVLSSVRTADEIAKITYNPPKKTTDEITTYFDTGAVLQRDFLFSSRGLFDDGSHPLRHLADPQWHLYRVGICIYFYFVYFLFFIYFW
jgi:hypothetical protein